MTEFTPTTDTGRFSGALRAFVVGVEPSPAISTESEANRLFRMKSAYQM